MDRLPNTGLGMRPKYGPTQVDNSEPVQRVAITEESFQMGGRRRANGFESVLRDRSFDSFSHGSAPHAYRCTVSGDRRSGGGEPDVSGAAFFDSVIPVQTERLS